jgi:hypothetical protein
MKLLIMAAAVLALGACSDPGNRPAGERSPDTKSFDMAKNGNVAPGWNSGDAASWEAQLRRRAQAQNEYARVPL